MAMGPLSLVATFAWAGFSRCFPFGNYKDSCAEHDTAGNGDQGRQLSRYAC